MSLLSCELSRNSAYTGLLRAEWRLEANSGHIMSTSRPSLFLIALPDCWENSDHGTMRRARESARRSPIGCFLVLATIGNKVQIGGS